MGFPAEEGRPAAANGTITAGNWWCCLFTAPSRFAAPGSARRVTLRTASGWNTFAPPRVPFCLPVRASVLCKSHLWFGRIVAIWGQRFEESGATLPFSGERRHDPGRNGCAAFHASRAGGRPLRRLTAARYPCGKASNQESARPRRRRVFELLFRHRENRLARAPAVRRANEDPRRPVGRHRAQALNQRS